MYGGSQRHVILLVACCYCAVADEAAGALSTLLSSTFWQISAIYLSLPVSGSHSIVSGLIGNILRDCNVCDNIPLGGFTLVAHGSEGVNWSKTGWIFLGWFLSPLISLLLTAILYTPIYFLVVKSRNPYSVISKIFYSFVIGLTFRRSAHRVFSPSIGPTLLANRSCGLRAECL